MSPARAEEGLVGVASLRLRRAIVTALRQTVDVALDRNMVVYCNASRLVYSLLFTSFDIIILL